MGTVLLHPLYFPTIAEIGDILDLSELSEPNRPPINIPILPPKPVDEIKYPFIDKPIIELPIERELEYRRRRSLFEGIYIIFISAI
jgi:hypothetical protein